MKITIALIVLVALVSISDQACSKKLQVCKLLPLFDRKQKNIHFIQTWFFLRRKLKSDHTRSLIDHTELLIGFKNFCDQIL